MLLFCLFEVKNRSQLIDLKPKSSQKPKSLSCTELSLSLPRGSWLFLACEQMCSHAQVTASSLLPRCQVYPLPEDSSSLDAFKANALIG